MTKKNKSFVATMCRSVYLFMHMFIEADLKYVLYNKIKHNHITHIRCYPYKQSHVVVKFVLTKSAIYREQKIENKNEMPHIKPLQIFIIHIITNFFFNAQFFLYLNMYLASIRAKTFIFFSPVKLASIELFNVNQINTESKHQLANFHYMHVFLLLMLLYA